MSRALVITGANFSANKVAHVNFNDKPCTSISFGQSSYTINSAAGVTVSFTKVPSNTTDVVILTASPAGIVTIDGNTVKAVGFGSATLKAVCGSATATATVTVSSVVKTFSFVVEGADAGSPGWGTPPPCRIGSDSRYKVYVNTIAEETGSNYALSNVHSMTIGALSIPSGATKIKVVGNSSGFTETRIFWATNTSLYQDKYVANVSPSTEVVDRTSVGYVEVDVPSGANCFVMRTVVADARTYSFEFKNT